MASILPLPPAIVGEFVGRSHNDMMRVTELLNAYPTVVNAAWDWGNGDWETGLAAAAHSGRKDIAELILSRGGRIDLLAAVMLGKIDLVKALLKDNPAALHHNGPHGISLLALAEAGKNREMISYLKGLLHPAKKSFIKSPAAKMTKMKIKPSKPSKTVKRRKAA